MSSIDKYRCYDFILMRSFCLTLTVGDNTNLSLLVITPTVGQSINQNLF